MKIPPWHRSICSQMDIVHNERVTKVRVRLFFFAPAREVAGVFSYMYILIASGLKQPCSANDVIVFPTTT